MAFVYGSNRSSSCYDDCRDCYNTLTFLVFLIPFQQLKCTWQMPSLKHFETLSMVFIYFLHFIYTVNSIYTFSLHELKNIHLHQSFKSVEICSHHEHPLWLPVKQMHRQASTIQICSWRAISINSWLNPFLQFLSLLFFSSYPLWSRGFHFNAA